MENQLGQYGLELIIIMSHVVQLESIGYIFDDIKKLNNCDLDLDKWQKVDEEMDELIQTFSVSSKGHTVGLMMTLHRTDSIVQKYPTWSL